MQPAFPEDAAEDVKKPTQAHFQAKPVFEGRHLRFR